MKNIFAVGLCLYLCVAAIPALAEDMTAMRGDIIKKMESIYARPGTRAITEKCRSMAKSLLADPPSAKQYMRDNFTNEADVLACMAGIQLYRNNRMQAWNTADVADCMMNMINEPEYQQYRERAFCAALKADLMNYRMYLEAYYVDHAVYPKSADFELETAQEKRSVLANLSKHTEIDYKPSADLQTYTVSAHSKNCKSVYFYKTGMSALEELKNEKNGASTVR